MKTPRTLKLPPFFTQNIGAIPRPRAVLDLFTRRAEFSAERYTQIMDDLVRFSIRMQGLTGLDVVSDGEWRGAQLAGEFLRRVGGFEPRRISARGEGATEVVVRRMSPTGSVFKADADFLIANTARLTKVSIPSPFCLSVRHWEEAYSKGAYATRGLFTEHLVQILAAEVHALVTGGVDIIQINDPILASLFDVPAGDAEGVFAQAAEAINKVVDAAGGKAEIHLHVHREQAGERTDYKELLPRLKGLRIDRVNVAFSGKWRVEELSLLPAGLDVGLGVLDVRGGVQQSIEEIKALAFAAANVLPPGRIALNPDCGFALAGGEEGESLDGVYDKLRRLTAAAREVRARFT